MKTNPEILEQNVVRGNYQLINFYSSIQKYRGKTPVLQEVPVWRKIFKDRNKKYPNRESYAHSKRP